jgi:hypothetical protein
MQPVTNLGSFGLPPNGIKYYGMKQTCAQRAITFFHFVDLRFLKWVSKPTRENIKPIAGA